MKKIIVKILIIGFCIIAPHNVFALSNDAIDCFSLPEENSKLELVLSKNADVLKEEWIANDTNTILTTDSIFQEGISYTYHLQLLNTEDAINIIEKLKNQNWDTTAIEVIDDKYDFKGVYTIKPSQQTQEIKNDVNDKIDNNNIENGWIEKNGNIYYYDNNNYLTGFQTIETDDGLNTYYFSINSGKMLTGFQNIGTEDGINTYYFSINSGKMLTGFQSIGTSDGINTYYFEENTGKMLTGFQSIETESGINTYYFSINSGKMLTGFQNIGTEDGINTYYFSVNGGKMLTGFQNIGTEDGINTYYFSINSGKLLTGFQNIGTEEGINTYYFSINSGKMLTGLQYINVDNYLFSSDGKMLVGIQKIGEDYYYFADDGKQKTGFQTAKEDNHVYTYYFSINSGKMLTGEQLIGTDIYYFGEDGKLNAKFTIVGDDTYYYDDNGTMLTGFQTIGSNTYYFSINSGKMLTGFQNIGTEDGIFTYYFSKSNGKMLTGFQNIGTDIGLYTYYFSINSGRMLTGVQKINNSHYVFYNDGRLMKGNAKVVVDISSWQEDIDFETLWKADVIDAVILRIAADAEREDPMFSQYIAEIKRLGIPYGIYIYSYAEDYNEGVIYANFMKSLIEKYDLNPTYGIYLDLESNGITQYMGPSEYEQVVRGFLSVLPTAKIYTYVNYANTALNSTYLRSLIDWIAHYHVYECAYTGSYRGWQFTDIASLPGIDGNVDLSIFNY